jgi:hypothetical protein
VNGRQADGEATWRTVAKGQDRLRVREFWYGEIGDRPRQEAITAAILALDGDRNSP